MKKQIILNDNKKVLFCLVQKNGNSNIEKLFLIKEGLFPADDLSRRIHVNNLSNLTKIRPHNFSVMPKDFSGYFKMTMVRNPLERLSFCIQTQT